MTEILLRGAFDGERQVAEIDPLVIDSCRRFALGAQLKTNRGTFTYARAGAPLFAGCIVMSGESSPVQARFGLQDYSGSVETPEVMLGVEFTIPADTYRDGYVELPDGQIHKVGPHGPLRDQPSVSLPLTSGSYLRGTRQLGEVHLYASPMAHIVPCDGKAVSVGVVLQDVAEGAYFWLQQSGVASVMAEVPPTPLPQPARWWQRAFRLWRLAADKVRDWWMREREDACLGCGGALDDGGACAICEEEDDDDVPAAPLAD